MARKPLHVNENDSTTEGSAKFTLLGAVKEAPKAPVTWTGTTSVKRVPGAAAPSARMESTTSPVATEENVSAGCPESVTPGRVFLHAGAARYGTRVGFPGAPSVTGLRSPMQPMRWVETIRLSR